MEASSILAGPGAAPGTDRRATATSSFDDIRAALYATKVVAYAQGFAHDARGRPGVRLGPPSWRDRDDLARRLHHPRALLEPHQGGVRRRAGSRTCCSRPTSRDAVPNGQTGWRRVISEAVEQGVPVPAFTSALAYYDGYRRERGPADLIQGLRDYFGAHTYRRTDADSVRSTRAGPRTGRRSRQPSARRAAAAARVSDGAHFGGICPIRGRHFNELVSGTAWSLPS